MGDYSWFHPDYYGAYMALAVLTLVILFVVVVVIGSCVNLDPFRRYRQIRLIKSESIPLAEKASPERVTETAA